MDILSEEKSFLQGQSPIAQAGQYLGPRKGFCDCYDILNEICVIVTKVFGPVAKDRNQPDLF